MSSDVIVRPSYLTENIEYDFGDIQSCIRPPWVKIVQSSSKPPYKPTYQDGDILITPHMQKIADSKTSFVFSPVLFYKSFVGWNPFLMRDKLPAVREYSTDEKSEVAIKALNFLREPCPENPQLLIRYNAVLNFLIILQDTEDFKLMPLILSFQSTHYKQGTALANLLQVRREPPFCRRIRCISKFYDHPSGGSYGFHCEYDENQYVSEEVFRQHVEINKNLSILAKENKIDANPQEMDDVEVDNSAF